MVATTIVVWITVGGIGLQGLEAAIDKSRCWVTEAWVLRKECEGTWGWAMTNTEVRENVKKKSAF